MIEHVSLHTRNHANAKKFYSAVLKPLGYKVQYDYSGATGYMEGGHTSFWISENNRVVPTHIAFRAKTKKAVHDFYKAALKAGATDNGAPGPRPDYSPDYFAAFVIDLDGHNVEAVWYDPGKRRKRSKTK